MNFYSLLEQNVRVKIPRGYTDRRHFGLHQAHVEPQRRPCYTDVWTRGCTRRHPADP